MEEINAFEIRKGPTLKQTYLEASGVEVNLDYFLFTCFEEEATHQALPPKHRRQFDLGRWPVILAAKASGSLAAAYEERGLETILQDLCEWYAVNYPMLKDTRVLDYTAHSELLGPYVRLVLDLKDLVLVKTKEALPFYDSELKAELQSEPWAALKAALLLHFPSYGEKMLAYLAWSAHKTKAKEYDLASLPPVGRFAAILQRFKRRQEGRRPFASGGDSGGGYRERDGGGRGREENSKTRAKESGKKESGRSKEPAEHSASHRDGAKKSPRKPEGRGSSVNVIAKESSDREGSALHEVEEALAKLKNKDDLQEYLLAPQNSFIRRKQHKKIVDEGYFSESSGEGSERAVRILRQARSPD